MIMRCCAACGRLSSASAPTPYRHVLAYYSPSSSPEPATVLYGMGAFLVSDLQLKFVVGVSLCSDVRSSESHEGPARRMAGGHCNLRDGVASARHEISRVYKPCC